MDSEFVREVRKGFQSTFVYRCSMCGKETILNTNPAGTINSALVAGVLAGGGGFANLEEIAAAVDMPCMAHTAYIVHERKVGKLVETAAMNSMLQAGQEEKRLAVEAGDVSADGTPWIRVIADGMWSKRSYKTKYDAKSGLAAIIGFRTNKVLFYGVRNKHCFVCTLDQNRKRPVRAHNCAKNFEGAPNKMEANIIVEGFLLSEEMHGLRFTQLVADRDSSVHTELLTRMPYGPRQLVEKIHCKNHMLRNFRSWILELSGNAHLPLPSHVDPKDKAQVLATKRESYALRTVIKGKMRKLSNAVSSACRYRARENGSMSSQLLRKDILNAGAHVFGQHTACDPYFCRTAIAREGEATTAAQADDVPCTAAASHDITEENFVPRLQRAGLWSEIIRYLTVLGDNAGSLIHNANNNQAEVLNGVVAKFIGGKRIIYSKRASFNTRCGAATLSLNTSGQFQRVIMKDLQGMSPGRFMSQHLRKRSAQLRKNRMRRALLRTAVQQGARRAQQTHGPDQDYGLGGQAPQDQSLRDALPPQDTEEELGRLQARISELMTKFQDDLLRQDEMSSLKQNTPEWEQQRAFRLCASSFGRVCRRMPQTSAKNIVKDLVHCTHKQATGSMRTNFAHGHATEVLAIEKLREKYGIDFVRQCGIFIDKEYPFLGASPDGLIGNKRLLEIKCPISGEKYGTLEEALVEKKIPYLTFDPNKNVILNKRHDYFFQVQGQLHIADKESTLFYVFTSQWQKELIINRDDDFWKLNMEVQLIRFYKEAFLPEKLSPRFKKELRNVADIREPAYIQQAIEEYSTQKKRTEQHKEEMRKGIEARRQVRQQDREEREENIQKKKKSG